jgi:trehalose 6-phosphate synthase/phosphatase
VQDLKQRRGTSALYDSFAYLSSNDTPWNHTLIGWTGEMEETEELTPPATPPQTTTATKIPPLNKSSAPIPLDDQHPITEPVSEGTRVSKADRERLEWQLSHDNRCKTLPVWLHDDNEINEDGDLCVKGQGRWRRFAEHELYPLLHYKQHFPTDGRREKSAWADYVHMNEKFAAKILEVYKPGDMVMIHDYHLLLLPAILRKKIPHMYISFFLHVPFPSSEVLRCLPQRNEILSAMLGANLVGFQSYSYLRHFVSCCTRVLGFPSNEAGVEAYGTKIAVGVFPIGIDAANVEKLAFGRPEIDQNVKGLKTLYEGKKIIVGRDRLDSVRGVAQKLMAFERFLDEYPEWREKVVLIQVTTPTATEEEKEDTGSRIATKVADLVAKINGLYGSLGFSPVQHYPQYLSNEEYLALLRSADCGLITSVRDGMNTTSLEYVVCQRDNHGPLILSEFSGTAGSLAQAIHINPWDLTGVADAINYALTLPEDKKQQLHETLYDHVTNHNVQAWSSGCIKRLLTVLASRKSSVVTPILDVRLMKSQYDKANKRLFMFDYDGTLTPIVRDPSSATPSKLLLQTLETLAADPKNNVWIISGRDQEFLTAQLGHIPQIGFSAEHGSFIRHPGETTKWENLAETTDMSWQKDVMDIFQKYTERTQGEYHLLIGRIMLTFQARSSSASDAP